MSKPFASVLIDTYNHERFIEQALVSVLEQDVSQQEMEIIVVDDGSTDNTAAIARKFLPHIRYLRKENGGQASAFNAGIPEARGQVVAFLDGDDWWAPGKLHTVLDCLDSNPEVGAVGHGLYEAYADGRPPRSVTPDRTYRLHLKDAETAELFSHLRAFLGTSRLTVRKTVLDRILPVPEELVIESDEYIFTLAPTIAPVIVLEQPLFYYRLHGDNLFQFSSDDPEKNRRRQAVMSALLRHLPPRLAEFGVAPEVVRAVLEPIWVDAERIRLWLDSGSRWQAFRVEQTDYRLSYRTAGIGYRAFKTFVLSLTLALPPRNFYRLRRWYSARDLRKLRRWVGEPIPANRIIESRTRI